jgi:hypothetical protein
LRRKITWADTKGDRFERLWWGFAHLIRPTYPGFPVKIGGVELLHAAFFERKPHTRSWLVMRSKKSGQRWCEHGAPRRSCGSVGRHAGEVCGGTRQLVDGMEPTKSAIAMEGVWVIIPRGCYAEKDEGRGHGQQ